MGYPTKKQNKSGEGSGQGVEARTNSVETEGLPWHVNYTAYYECAALFSLL